MIGEVTVHVELSTTGLDTDVAVRLVDIDDSGVARLMGEGIQRLTSRDEVRSFSEVTSGERYTVEVALLSHLAYTLPVGHRLGLILTASNWPLFARNPSDGAVFMASDVSPSTNETFS